MPAAMPRPRPSSRWLNRLVNLLGGLPDQQGPQALADMRARGRRLAGPCRPAEAQPRMRTPPARRPSPIPPAPALRDMSVTEVRSLIRDPYAVYARRVLGLRALDPAPRTRRGRTRHSPARHHGPVPEGPAGNLPEDAELMAARLLEITDRVLDEKVPWPSAKLFWARIAGVAQRLMTDEAARLTQGRPAVDNARRTACPRRRFPPDGQARPAGPAGRWPGAGL